MEVSLALQGGGAKVIDLLASIVAAKEIEAIDPDFRIVRASGSSAGAITAAVLATNCDIDEILLNRDQVQRLLAKKFRTDKLGKFKLATKFLFGQSIFKEKDLTELITLLFRLGGVDASKPVRSLVADRELRIVRSDILGDDTPVADENSESPLVSVLVDSCSIPFVFRVPGRSNTPYILDGGLFQNLPAQEAAKSLAIDQHCIGISFENPEKPDIQKASFTQFASTILESMLNERVKDSIFQLGDSNVIKLKSRHGTLNFHNIFDDQFEKKFKETKEQVHADLVRWKERRLQLEGPDWFSNNPTDIIRQYETTESEFKKFFHEAINNELVVEHADHTVYLRSALNPDVPDVYVFEIKLLGRKNIGLQYLRFKFYDSETGSLQRARVDVTDSDGKKRNAMQCCFP